LCESNAQQFGYLGSGYLKATIVALTILALITALLAIFAVLRRDKHRKKGDYLFDADSSKSWKMMQLNKSEDKQ